MGFTLSPLNLVRSLSLPLCIIVAWTINEADWCWVDKIAPCDSIVMLLTMWFFFLFFHLPYWSITPIIVDVLLAFTALLFLEYSSCFETNKLTCLLGNVFFQNPSNSCYIFLLYLNFENIIVRLITCFLCSYHACQIFSKLDTIYHSINKIIFYA